MTPYFGPCRAGLHPEFGWGEPCLNDASEYVSVLATSMKLCTEHADEAERNPEFNARQPMRVPYEPPVVTL